MELSAQFLDHRESLLNRSGDPVGRDRVAVTLALSADDPFHISHNANSTIGYETLGEPVGGYGNDTKSTTVQPEHPDIARRREPDPRTFSTGAISTGEREPAHCTSTIDAGPDDPPAKENHYFLRNHPGLLDHRVKWDHNLAWIGSKESGPATGLDDEVC